MPKWRCCNCGYTGYPTEFPYDYIPNEDGFDDSVPYCPRCRNMNLVEDTGDQGANNQQAADYD